MGGRKISVKQSAADNIAAIAWYIESKGLIRTAEKFTDDVYDFFIKIADNRKRYPVCRDPQRAILDYKCVSYKKKYIVVFIESENEIIICEFISSKLIHW
jgi:plasmid stabilization system protein ParE